MLFEVKLKISRVVVQHLIRIADKVTIDLVRLAQQESARKIGGINKMYVD